jgi:hypothetical protein
MFCVGTRSLRLRPEQNHLVVGTALAWLAA